MTETFQKTIYFASDFHLGAPNKSISLEREKMICAWMDSIFPSCEALYLVGDIFDFWFEYKHAIPKGFVRLQGKIAQFTDAGIPVHWFTGNHDMWIFDYIPNELGVTIHREPLSISMHGKKYYIAHGDGLGPGDVKYKLLKNIFSSKIIQSLFAFIHPNIGIGFAGFLSKRSRAKTGHLDEFFLGESEEWLIQYSIEIQARNKHDYYVYGHRHLPFHYPLNEATYVNLGEWLYNQTFAVIENGELLLKQWNGLSSVDFNSSVIPSKS